MARADDCSVPQNMQAVYDDVTRLTDEFCKALLDEGYALVCRRIAAALCRKRSSPMALGNLTHWVTGIIHAAGFVNFLWDRTQKPYMRAAEISERFDISNNTVSLKSKGIQRALRLIPLDPRYCLPSRLADNPPCLDARHWRLHRRCSTCAPEGPRGSLEARADSLLAGRLAQTQAEACQRSAVCGKRAGDATGQAGQAAAC